MIVKDNELKKGELPINKIVLGDCLSVMRKFPSNSISTIICDPPYGLKFMGKKWDYDVPSIEVWKECLRVLKPGGTALIFAGSRTQHRMAVNVEDAGFILKDTLMWLYGSGFPKATDISKQIDKNIGKLGTFNEFRSALNNIRKELEISQSEVNKHFNFQMAGHWFGNSQPTIPTREQWEELKKWWNISKDKIKELDRVFEAAEREVIGKRFDGSATGSIVTTGTGNLKKEIDITTPATPEAKLWNGWKSHGLKPAYEPILLCMKPNEGSYAQNALKWGVAGLNIDGGRIGTDRTRTTIKDFSEVHGNKWGKAGAKYPTMGYKENPVGRYPANIILECICDEVREGREIGRESGYNWEPSKQGNVPITKNIKSGVHYRDKQIIHTNPECPCYMLDEQSGILKSGARKGKSSATENRIFKLHGGLCEASQGGASRFFYCAKASKKERGEGNNHPTVKPLKLMEYLCTLTITPTGGIVLDPFMGSGTTGVACVNTKRNFIGIELDEQYYKIAQQRISDELGSL